MRKSFFLVFLFMTLFVRTEAIRIVGSAPDYAGQRLEFFTVADPVSKTPVPFFEVTIDGRGNFTIEKQITQNTYCFADVGVYRGRMVLVPGKDVRITLPPLREKSFEESKNPYFNPVDIWLKVNEGNKKELTNLIARYDARFYQLTDTYFNQLYYRQMKNYLDTVRIRLEREFEKEEEPGYQTHRHLRMKSLEADLLRTGREKVAGSLQQLTPQEWTQPAFSDFLNRLFVNTLSTESKSAVGTRMKMWVARENLAELSQWTQDFTATEGSLSDLILLKMLHDAFYSGEFSSSAILRMVQSPWFSQNKEPRIREMAASVQKKLAFLQTGTPAPEICLPSSTGTIWCSGRNTKPFLYLLFADLEIPVCREQVRYLKTMAEKTGSKVEFLIVLSPSQKVNNTEFMSSNQIPGIMVTDTPNRKTGKEYKVRSYPSAFLLDGQHRVVLAPARTPLDGFEFQYTDLKK